MFYAADAQEYILGRLLMDIVHGDLTDDTIELVRQLDLDDVPLPLGHIVSYLQGMNPAAYTQDDLNREMLDELRIITIEQIEDLYPTLKQKPTWQIDAPIPDQAVSIIKDLLLETLQGKIRAETLTALDDLGDLNQIPDPYKELLSTAQGSREDGKQIAGFLLYNLSGVIEEIKSMKQ